MAVNRGGQALMTGKPDDARGPSRGVQPQVLDKVILGDCLELMRSLPDGSVDLVVSSPPYNLGKEYESRQALEDYLAEQTSVLSECARLLSAKGSLFWQVGSFSRSGILIPLDIRVFPILEGCGLLPRNRIVWARQHGLHATRKFSCRYETLLWFTKTDSYTFNLDAIRVPQKYQNKKAWTGSRKGQFTCHPEGKNPGDIWLFRNVKHNHEEQTIHPCQFPEDMISRVVLATTDIGDLVFDPYMGAGTVAVVARNHGRRFLGTEIDSKYYAVCLRRLHAEPDANGCFPNLKTLRDYCERTGEQASQFRFDVQVGSAPSDRSQSRIFSETHHLTEMEERLAYEEEAFAADLRGHTRPHDRKLNGTGRLMSKGPQGGLFD
jgi:adenine-specific DNA-methyltransferase